MADGDAIVGGYLFAIQQLAKSVPWFAVPGDSSQEGLEAAKFLESCIYDMSTPARYSGRDPEHAASWLVIF
jgi:hypothetical protein